MEKSLHLRLCLKLFTQVATRHLKDRSFQIFGALTENALSVMTRDVKGRLSSCLSDDLSERDGT